MKEILLYISSFLLIAGINCNTLWCIGQNGRPGICVLSKNCMSTKLQYSTSCGGVYGYVCCVKNKIVKTTTTRNTPSKSKSSSKAKITPSSKFPKTCGPVANLLKHQIHGGTVSQSHEFPWIAVLEYLDNNDLSIRCAGSLINERYVLTAAHCLLPKLHSVRLGVHNIKTDYSVFDKDDNSPIQRRIIERNISHPNYKNMRLSGPYDIALLRMKSKVHFTDYVKAICLPDLKESAMKSPMNLTVAGWGSTGTGNADILRKVDVPLVENTKCENISKYQLCVGGQLGEDSCKGDSGGPLMRRNKGYWILEGVTSYGLSCGKETPGIYTNVRSHLEWIYKNVDDSN